jgi:hypothetical protein
VMRLADAPAETEIARRNAELLDSR